MDGRVCWGTVHLDFGREVEYAFVYLAKRMVRGNLQNYDCFLNTIGLVCFSKLNRIYINLGCQD